MRYSLLVVGCVLGCGGAGTGAGTTGANPGGANPTALVLGYGGGSIFGSDSFTIDGAGHLAADAEGGGHKEHRSGQVSADLLAALVQHLTELDCCALRSTRTDGVPDEAKIELDLAFPSLTCRVSLWANEWDSIPAAARCAKVVEAVRTLAR